MAVLHMSYRAFFEAIQKKSGNVKITFRGYHLTEKHYIINSETIVDVNNYIPFSTINSQTIDVM